jgi:hypothetical protein
MLAVNFLCVISLICIVQSLFLHLPLLDSEDSGIVLENPTSIGSISNQCLRIGDVYPRSRLFTSRIPNPGPRFSDPGS